MLSIRFFRTGKKNQPFFKIVVTDRRNAPRGGRFLEMVGFYNPITKEKQIKKERIQYWLGCGAQPSDTVYNLLVKEGVLTGSKVAVHKKPKKKALAAAASASAKATADKEAMASQEEATPSPETIAGEATPTQNATAGEAKAKAVQEQKTQDKSETEEKQAEPSPQEEAPVA